MRLGTVLSPLIAMVVSCAPEGAEAEGIQFLSQEGFAVHYPPQWVQIGTDNNLGPSLRRLDIVSSLPRVRGVVIGEGQAHIFVEKVSSDRSRTRVDHIEQLRLAPAQVLSSNQIVVRGDLGDECDTLLEVVTRETNGPASPEINHDFICRIGNDTFWTRLRYWAGDPKSEEYRRTAIAITRSIRIEVQ
jgi:hypothetical protein